MQAHTYSALIGMHLRYSEIHRRTARGPTHNTPVRAFSAPTPACPGLTSLYLQDAMLGVWAFPYSLTKSTPHHHGQAFKPVITTSTPSIQRDIKHQPRIYTKTYPSKIRNMCQRLHPTVKHVCGHKVEQRPYILQCGEARQRQSDCSNTTDNWSQGQSSKKDKCPDCLAK